MDDAFEEAPLAERRRVQEGIARVDAFRSALKRYRRSVDVAAVREALSEYDFASVTTVRWADVAVGEVVETLRALLNDGKESR